MTIDTNYPGLRAAHEGRFGNTELDLHKAARAGDKKAQMRLDAREARSAADLAVSKLADQASNGDAGALDALQRIAAGKAGAAGPAATTVPCKLTIDAAVKAAVSKERERWATVMRSEAAQGKQRACVGILTSPEAWSASQIIASLSAVSTDAQFDAKEKAKRAGENGAFWDKARRVATGEPSAVSGRVDGSPKPVANDPWARAYAGHNDCAANKILAAQAKAGTQGAR